MIWWSIMLLGLTVGNAAINRKPRPKPKPKPPVTQSAPPKLRSCGIYDKSWHGPCILQEKK